MATDYLIMIRGSGPSAPQAQVEALVAQLQAAGHAIDPSAATLESREAVDVSPAAIAQRGELAQAGPLDQGAPVDAGAGV